MAWWEALILGIVQGITEFFPVSSSGHLVMTERLLGLDLPGIGFAVALHVGTLISVMIVYREKLLALARGAFRRGDDSSWPYLLKLAVATVPVAVVGLSLKDWFEARFDDPAFTGTMLLVTGCFLWSTRWVSRQQRPGWIEFLPIAAVAVVAAIAGTLVAFVGVLALEAGIMAVARFTADRETRAEPGASGAFLMGIAQAVAIFPGVSRSGSTVVTGLWRRIDPVMAAEFSFLMSIPAILGAAVLDVPTVAVEGFAVPTVPLLVGFLGAAVSGVLAIRYFVAMLKRRSFHNFSWYCWIAGSFFLLTL